MSQFTSEHHRQADADYRQAVATNQAQMKAGNPRFHFKFDVNGLGKPGGSYKPVGIDETGPGSITGTLASYIASGGRPPRPANTRVRGDNEGPGFSAPANGVVREYKSIGVCADCGGRVRKTVSGGTAQIVHINGDGATAMGDHPARILSKAEGLNRGLSRQWNPDAFDENGIAKPGVEFFEGK